MPVINHIVLDPRVAVTENPIQNNLLGPVSVIPFRTASQSCNSNNIQFSNMLSPGSNTYLSKNMVLEYDVNVEVFGTGTAVMTGANGDFGTSPTKSNSGVNTCFRSYPLTRNMSALELTLNGTKLSVNPAQSFQCLAPFVHTDKQRREWASMFPSQLDTCPLLAPDAVVAASSQSNQPLSPYCNGEVSRASIMPTAAGPAAGAAGTYTFKIYEPLLISPLDSGAYDEKYLANVRDFQININLQDSSLISLLTSSIALTNGGATAATGVTVTLGTQAFLHYSYIQPPEEKQNVEVAIYPYSNIYFQQSVITGPTTVASVPLKAVGQSIKLSVLPKLIYISVACRTTNAFRPTQELDVSAVIDELSIQWGSKGSQFLNNYDSYDLWRMTMRNTGSDLSFNEWKNGSCVVVFRPAVDIGNNILSLEGGNNSSLMFQIMGCNFNTKNYERVAVDPTNAGGWFLNTVVVNEGQLTLTDGQCATNIAVISPAEGIQALSLGLHESDLLTADDKGGSLFGSLKSLIHKGADMLSSDAGRAVVGKIKDFTGGSISAGSMGGAITAGRFLKSRK